MLMASAEHMVSSYFSSFAVANLVAAPKVHEIDEHEDKETCRYCKVKFDSVRGRRAHEKRYIPGGPCHTKTYLFRSKRVVER